MKKLLLALLILGILTFPSCASNRNKSSDGTDLYKAGLYKINSSEPDSNEMKYDGKVVYNTMKFDWYIYDNAQEVIERASHVLIGRVTNISFQVLDLKTGLPPTDKTEESHDWLYTIYDVDVITRYKGETSKSFKVAVEGGLHDYRVKEQLEVLGKNAKNGISVTSGIPEVKVGETYLFAVRQYNDLSAYIINPEQSIYNLRDPFEKNILHKDELYDPAKYYNEKTNQYGNVLISAKDVIKVFGEDKWSTFWARWQQDNPEWETWLDKTAVEKALER